MARLLAVAALAVSASASICDLDRKTGYLAAACAKTVSWVDHFSKPSAAAAAGGPEQHSINYGATPDVMVIGWLTSDVSAATAVRYGTSSGNYPNTVTGNSTTYTYSAKYTSGAIHHVWLTGLAAGTRYYYQAGSTAAWSQEFSFMSSPGVGPEIPHMIAYIGDIGENKDANDTVNHIIAANPDSVIINGDLSYASGCESTGCATWDAFQRMMSPLTAVKPFAVNIGNHETYDTANGIVAISTKYRYLGMPTSTPHTADGAMYFAYEVGPAHIISISSFYPNEAAPDYSDKSPITVWLKAHLPTIDRSKTPWLLVSIHAPWYNSNSEHQGDGEPMRVAFEPLFVAAKVDAIFSGHVHAYERSFLVNNNVVDTKNGIQHFNIGDAGASLYTKWTHIGVWSAFRSATFGHGNLQMFNSTTALWTWHQNVNAEPVVSDSIVLTCKAASM